MDGLEVDVYSWPASHRLRARRLELPYQASQQGLLPTSATRTFTEVIALKERSGQSALHTNGVAGMG
jgi:hypothetical protein